MSYDMKKPTQFIPTFIINLKNRNERREHILAEFVNRAAFDIHLIEPIPDKIAAKSLWLTVKRIVQLGMAAHHDFILLCEDDHCFTKNFSIGELYNCISEADDLHCEILCGGVNSVRSTFSVSKNLYWMEQFTGLQFTIIFCRFYSTLLQLPFDNEDCADILISRFAKQKFVIHPFISVQKEFGYSDVTISNNQAGFISDLFLKASERVHNLKKVADFYKKFPVSISQETNYDNVYIPTFVLHDTSDKRHSENIQNQFVSRTEFDISIINRPAGADTGLLIKSIVKEALINGDDLIIIVSDTICFSSHYNKSLFINTVIQANQSGASLLLGNTFGFDSAVFTAPGIAWLNSFSGSDMLIIFKPMYKAILNDPHNREPDGSDKLSALTSHKMIIYPFIIESNSNLAPEDHFFVVAAEKRLGFIQSSQSELLVSGIIKT
jgi:hypothetical protein